MESEEENPLSDAVNGLAPAEQIEEAGEYDKALAQCDQVIETVGPFLAEVHNLRGIILEELKRTQEALEAYEKALAVDGRCLDAAENLSELEQEQGVKHNLVTIASYSQEGEAQVVRGRLEAEGIWAVVADEGIVNANWLYSIAVGGVKVRVRESDVERALSILGIELQDDELEQEEESAKCPRCGSAEIRYELFERRAVFGSWLVLSVPLPFAKRKWRCKSCGYEWRWDNPLEGDGETGTAYR
jgi:tetratricopeptide (TPR) repeat protein